MEKAIQPRLSDVENELPESYPYWKEIVKIKMDH